MKICSLLVSCLKATGSMAVETPGEEFHVVIWRMSEGKLGLQVVVADNTLRIHAITGWWVKKMNQRCRTCQVGGILHQQLLETDQVVTVNGVSDIKQMLGQLTDVKVECCHL